MDPVMACRAPLIFLRKFRRRALQNRSGPYGSIPRKKSRTAMLHCGIEDADRARRDKLRKKMPPSGWKTAPISRVDPALFFMSPSGVRSMLNNACPALADNSLIGYVLSSNPIGGLCRPVVAAARLSARLEETIRQHRSEDNWHDSFLSSK